MTLFGQRTPARDDSLTRVELARLEGTVSALVAEHQAQRTTSESIRADFELRLRRAERFMYSAPISAIAAIIASLAAVLHK